MKYGLLSASDQRLLHRYPSAAAEWFDRFDRDYVSLPQSKNNLVDHTTHAFAGALDVVIEGPDMLYDFVARKIDGTTHPVNAVEGEMGLIRRDAHEVFGKDRGIATRVAGAVRSPGSVGMDFVHFGLGINHKR